VTRASTNLGDLGLLGAGQLAGAGKDLAHAAEAGAQNDVFASLSLCL